MSSWTYSNYCAAVRSAVQQGVCELGYTLDQAVGYARFDLELRIEDHPDEVPLVLIALAMVVAQQGSVAAYVNAGGGLAAELQAVIGSDALARAASQLPPEDAAALAADVRTVSSAFGLPLSAGV